MGGFRVPLYRPGGQSIADLMMRQGDIQAQRAARSGEIWGGALANVGQQVGQAVQQHAEQKELSKRDAALSRWLDSGEWQRDPMGAVKILGPERGAKLAEGLLSYQRLQATKGQEAMKLLPGLIAGVDALPEPLRPGAYSAARSAILQSGVIRPGDVPEQYSAETWAPISAYGKALRGDKPKGPMEVSPGASVIDPEHPEKGALFTAPKPTEPPKPPQPRVVGRSLVTDEGKVIYRDPEGAKDERLVQVMGPDGPTWVRESQAVGKPAAQAARAVTGQERQSLAYYNRANQASEDIAPLESKIAKAGLASQTQLQYAPNIFQTEEQQKYRQAQRAFTEARLRKESGAAIPTHEYTNDAKTYFAQPGDDEATIKQKQEARQVVLDGLRFGAGKAYDEFYGEPAPTPKNRSIKPIKDKPKKQEDPLGIR